MPELESMPELFEDLQSVWKAFQDLSKSRTSGFDANPIQASEINSWLSIHGITEQEKKEDFYTIIIELDRYLMNAISDKRKKDKK